MVRPSAQRVLRCANALRLAPSQLPAHAPHRTNCTRRPCGPSRGDLMLNANLGPGGLDLDAVVRSAQTIVVDAAFKVVAAVALSLAGRWLISFVVHLIQRALERQQVDPTVLRYTGTVVGVLLNLSLVVAILGYFGVQTTTFAALLAGAGIAIGTAWGGLLSNFAAGAFLVVLRPFKVGDFVSAGDCTGTVTTVGLFATTIQLPDNVVAHVGNGKILSSTILNYSAPPARRVELKAQLHPSVNPEDAIDKLRIDVAKIKIVAASPEPRITSFEF